MDGVGESKSGSRPFCRDSAGVRSLDTFHFSYQPPLAKKQIQTLSSCHFIEHGENVVFLGPPGAEEGAVVGG